MLDQFRAVDKECRYHLMLMGAPGLEAHKAQEVPNDVFVIAFGTRGAEVSWKVTDIRLGAFADESRIPNAMDQEGAKCASDRSWGLQVGSMRPPERGALPR